jgi:hypothetical protein
MRPGLTSIVDTRQRSRILMPADKAAHRPFIQGHAVFSSLKRSTRRLLVLLSVLPATVVVLGTVYMLGMTHLKDAVFICGSIKSLERCQGEFRASTAQSPQAA